MHWIIASDLKLVTYSMAQWGELWFDFKRKRKRTTCKKGKRYVNCNILPCDTHLFYIIAFEQIIEDADLFLRFALILQCASCLLHVFEFKAMQRVEGKNEDSMGNKDTQKTNYGAVK